MLTAMFYVDVRMTLETNTRGFTRDKHKWREERLRKEMSYKIIEIIKVYTKLLLYFCETFLFIYMIYCKPFVYNAI